MEKFNSKIDLIKSLIENGNKLYFLNKDEKYSKISMSDDGSIKGISPKLLMNTEYVLHPPFEFYEDKSFGMFWDNEDTHVRIFGFYNKEKSCEMTKNCSYDFDGADHKSYDNFEPIEDIPDWAKNVQW